MIAYVRQLAGTYLAAIVPFTPTTVEGVPAEVQFHVIEPVVGIVEAVAVPPVNTAAPSNGFNTSVLFAPTTPVT
jgi:hypothetical protein